MTNEEAAAILESEAEYLYSQDEPYNRQAFNMAIEALQERKTGKWVRADSYNTFKCSVCGNFLNFHGVNAGRGDANYCPNCGAKMKED